MISLAIDVLKSFSFMGLSLFPERAPFTHVWGLHIAGKRIALCLNHRQRYHLLSTQARQSGVVPRGYNRLTAVEITAIEQKGRSDIR